MTDEEVEGDGWAGIEHVQAFLEELPGGSVLSHLIDVMPAVQKHKARAMLEQLLVIAEIEGDDLVREMQSRPRLRRLIWQASRAAADTELEQKVKALARVAAQSVNDDAAIDEGEILVRTIARLEAYHVRAVVALAEWPANQDYAIDDELGVGPGLAALLGADLTSLALANTTGMSFTGVRTTVHPSNFGRQVASYLLDEA
jgi:hypothetical protein